VVFIYNEGGRLEKGKIEGNPHVCIPRFYFLFSYCFSHCRQRATLYHSLLHYKFRLMLQVWTMPRFGCEGKGVGGVSGVVSRMI
jgi:hypothetical protein